MSVHLNPRVINEERNLQINSSLRRALFCKQLLLLLAAWKSSLCILCEVKIISVLLHAEFQFFYFCRKPKPSEYGVFPTKGRSEEMLIRCIALSLNESSRAFSNFFMTCSIDGLCCLYEVHDRAKLRTISNASFEYSPYNFGSANSAIFPPSTICFA